MKKLLAFLLVGLFSIGAVLASGYGGYDEEPVEVQTVYVEMKGQLKATCEASAKTISENLNITGCYDMWEEERDCQCLEDNGFSVCEERVTFACQAEYEYY